MSRNEQNFVHVMDQFLTITRPNLKKFVDLSFMLAGRKFRK